MAASATLVDSNVLLDVLTGDASWSAWSSDAIAEAADRGALVINPVIYAEVSVRFTRIEELDDVLDPRDFRRDALPWGAAFLAAKAFAAYRGRGGQRPSTLPEFFIGAHAAVESFDLLTRDVQRYRTSFPTVTLRSPPLS